jgi:hypothetical protein
MASQPIAGILFTEQLGEIGQRVQMLLELALRHEEQHHQIDRFAVQRVELNSFARTSNRPDHFRVQARPSSVAALRRVDGTK